MYCNQCHNARALAERPFSNYQNVAATHARSGLLHGCGVRKTARVLAPYARRTSTDSAGRTVAQAVDLSRNRSTSFMTTSRHQPSLLLRSSRHRAQGDANAQPQPAPAQMNPPTDPGAGRRGTCAGPAGPLAPRTARQLARRRMIVDRVATRMGHRSSIVRVVAAHGASH